MGGNPLMLSSFAPAPRSLGGFLGQALTILPGASRPPWDSLHDDAGPLQASSRKIRRPFACPLIEATS